jgi:hypothetical protein
VHLTRTILKLSYQILLSLSQQCNSPPVAEEQVIMEIKTVGDLIPYRASLKELWGREEFQPVVALFSSMRDEAIMGVRTLGIIGATPHDVIATASQLKTQLNLTNMLLELPAVIKEMEDRLAQVEMKKGRMREAQEGATI